MISSLMLVLAGVAAGQTAENRAIQYLARETPAWFRENQCFSCHNNGDGARALYAAARMGYAVPAGSLADTTRWLAAPSEWDENRGSPQFSDKKLARIQFAAALTEAHAANMIENRDALVAAARLLLPYQESDGSWRVDADGGVGSPATYGTALATYFARRALSLAGDPESRAAAARAEQWLRTAKPESTLDAGAILLALADSDEVKARLIPVVLAAQTSDGGWGPRRHAPAEAFDTAVVLLALHAAGEPERTRVAVARGREFLIRMQLESGGWPETTRPPGSQSYAQHISTSGWAALALLMTDPER